MKTSTTCMKPDCKDVGKYMMYAYIGRTPYNQPIHKRGLVCPVHERMYAKANLSGEFVLSALPILPNYLYGREVT
jgi:hypothetical protein